MSPHGNSSSNRTTTPTHRPGHLAMPQQYSSTPTQARDTKWRESDDDLSTLGDPEDPVALQRGETSTGPLNDRSVTAGITDYPRPTTLPSDYLDWDSGSSSLSKIDEDNGSSSSTKRDEPSEGQDFSVDVSTSNNDAEPEELPDRQIFKKPRLSVKDRSKWSNPEEMLTNERSPLANAKLRVSSELPPKEKKHLCAQIDSHTVSTHFSFPFFLTLSIINTSRTKDILLCHPQAWDILTPKEKHQILSKFPDDREVRDPGTEKARPDTKALLNNDNFRNDVARYQEDLRQGYHDPAWIEQAQMAHRAREAGAYDEELATEFRDRWDMPMPMPGNPTGPAGAARKV